MPIRIHEFLLGLAGRLDDDALADAREMLASAELDRSLEFAAGCLAAGGVALSEVRHRELGELFAGTNLDPSVVERVVVRDEVPAYRHRFAVGAVDGHEPDEGVVAAVRPVLDVLPDVRSVWCVWRLTPSGPVSGPVPHRVVLVGVGPGGFAPATAYRVEYALRRAGIRASVEVLVDGSQPGPYHQEAMRCARQVPFDDPGPGGGKRRSVSPGEPVRAEVPAGGPVSPAGGGFVEPARARADEEPMPAAGTGRSATTAGSVAGSGASVAEAGRSSGGSVADAGVAAKSAGSVAAPGVGEVAPSPPEPGGPAAGPEVAVGDAAQSSTGPAAGAAGSAGESAGPVVPHAGGIGSEVPGAQQQEGPDDSSAGDPDPGTVKVEPVRLVPPAPPLPPERPEPPVRLSRRRSAETLKSVFEQQGEQGGARPSPRRGADRVGPDGEPPSRPRLVPAAPPAPAPPSESKDRHSAAFVDDMLNTQERNLLRELQDELARREKQDSEQGQWRSGRHGKPGGGPMAVNGVPPQPDSRDYGSA